MSDQKSIYDTYYPLVVVNGTFNTTGKQKFRGLKPLYCAVRRLWMNFCYLFWELEGDRVVESSWGIDSNGKFQQLPKNFSDAPGTFNCMAIGVQIANFPIKIIEDQKIAGSKTPCCQH